MLTPERGVRAVELPFVLGRGGLGVTTLKTGSDGIAYVAKLLEHAIAEITGETADIVALDAARPGIVTAAEKIRFATRLAQRQMAGAAKWWLFNHVGIARVQNLIPKNARRPYGVFLMGIEAWDKELAEDRKRCLGDAKTLLAISNHTANRVREVHPELDRVVTCHLALLPQENNRGPDETVIQQICTHSVLILGRMSASERYKGHDQLLECWPQVLASVPNAQLVVAGDGDDAPRLKEKAASLGIADRVVFTGFVDAGTLDEIRRRAALFVMPSKNEGFGLVYLEAMREGLACVASNVDAASEIVIDGETGHLVDPENREELAGCISLLLSNDELRRRMGAAGKARFEENFRFDHFVNRLRPILVDAFGSADSTS